MGVPFLGQLFTEKETGHSQEPRKKLEKLAPNSLFKGKKVVAKMKWRVF